MKIYNTSVLPTFLYGSENLTLRALQRGRTEAAEMKLLRPLAGYILYDHKTNDYICCELQIAGILDKIDEYRRNWSRHLQRMPQNRILLKEGEQLEDRRNVGESSCNFGDGTDQRVQSLTFMMMMMMMMMVMNDCTLQKTHCFCITKLRARGKDSHFFNATAGCVQHVVTTLVFRGLMRLNQRFCVLLYIFYTGLPRAVLSECKRFLEVSDMCVNANIMQYLHMKG